MLRAALPQRRFDLTLVKSDDNAGARHDCPGEESGQPQVARGSCGTREDALYHTIYPVLHVVGLGRRAVRCDSHRSASKNDSGHSGYGRERTLHPRLS